MSVAMPAAEPDRVAPPTGRLRDNSVDDTGRNYAVAMHLTPLSFFVIGFFGLAIPLVLWAIRKDRCRFDDDHGREVVNFWLSQAILHLGLGITMVGVVLWPVLWIVALVSMIRGSMAASKGEYFRYPITFRMV